MKVVILCGGEGTRLRELTEAIPKALVEIGGYPIIWHIMKYYSHYGFNDFILCLGYKGELIKQYFIDHKWRSNNFSLSKEGNIKFHTENFNEWNINFVDTGRNSNKAERLKQVQHLIGDDELFFATYADDLSNVDLKKLLDFHKKHNKIVSLITYRAESPLGVIEFDSNGMINMFREKPILNQWMNAGYFVFNKRIFNYLHQGDLETEVLPKLVEENQIYAFKHNGCWKPMNTFKDHVDLNKLWDDGLAEWKVWKD